MDGRSRMRLGTSAAVLFVSTVIVFAITVTYPFVYEDTRDAHLTMNPEMIPHQITAQPFRATTHLSRWIDLTIFGIQPWGFHLSNVLWHAVNVTLLLSLAWMVLPPWGAIAAAVVFGWHPIQVEAVTYISARADLVATFGVLLALVSATRRSLLGALVGVVFATLTKETAIVAWGLVFLWVAWIWETRILRYWIWLAALGALVTILLIWQAIYLARWVTVDQILIGTQLADIWRLLLLLPLPYGFTIDHDWGALVWLGPLALIGSLGLTAWALTDGWWGRHWLAFGWLWTLIALSPRLVVPLQEGLHERHMYPVLIGWALCAGAWLTRHDSHGEMTYG